MLNLSPLSTELFLSVGCECLPDSRARTGEKRAGGVGGLGKKGILVNVETQLNFRSQAVLSGNKQHLRMLAVFYIAGYVRTLRMKRGHLNYPASLCGFLLVGYNCKLFNIIRGSEGKHADSINGLNSS